MSKKKLNKGEICPECGAQDGEPEFDPFDCGDLLDIHMDTEVDEEEIAKRLANAAQMCKQLAGTVPGGFLDELGLLSKPKLTWQDFIRSVKQKKQRGEGKSDWAAPKRRPLFAGLYTPTKKNYRVKFLLGVDTSGSMSTEQISFIVSQIAALEGRGDGVIVCWDAYPAWKEITKIKNASIDELQKVKRIGGGGTSLMPLLDTYEEEVGQVDILVIGSDFYLSDTAAVMDWVPPKGTQVVWLSVGNPQFKPKHGRLFNLNNE